MLIYTEFVRRTTISGCALGFLAGVLIVQQLPDLPAPWWGLVVVPLLLWRRARAALPLVFLATGAAWTVLRAGLVLDAGLPAELESRDLWVEGVVVDVPDRRGRALRFRFAIEGMSVDGSEYPSPGDLLLRDYGKDQLPLGPGQRWRLKVRLKRPHGFRNPGGFDYEGWLFAQRISATGYVRADPDNGRLTPDGGHYVDRLRAGAAARIATVLPDSPYSGLISALSTGVRSGISDEQWEVMRRTGTNHLMAISGLHIGLVAGLVFLVSRFLWAAVGRLALWWPAPLAATVLAVLAAAAYAALAGFSVPTQRALIMLVVAAAALLMRRPLEPVQVLAAALLAVLVFDPLAVMSAGLWLSFAAVAVIMYFVNGRVVRRRRWAGPVYVQLAVSIGLLPALLGMYGQVPLLGPLANLIAVPVVGFVVVPLSLTGVAGALILPPALSDGCLQLAAWVLGQLWRLLEVLASTEQGVWVQHTPPSWALACAAIGAACLLAPRGWPARWVGVVWLAPAVFIVPAAPRDGELWFTLLDVGQGLAAVAQTRHHTLVYDAGPRFSSRFDTGRAVVVPFLHARGIGSVDVLLVSHGDNDHIGGVRSLLEDTPVERVLSSVPERLPGARPCEAGQTWRWDGVDFAVLHPPAGRYGSGNDSSCVLKVSGPFGSVLLPGDIEAGAEWALQARYGDALDSTVLVAPHHGSRTSSSEIFLAAVNPALALFPVGYRNRYGHPHPLVVQRYDAAGVERLDSANDGAVTVRFGAGGRRVERYRLEERRYWHTASE